MVYAEFHVKNENEINKAAVQQQIDDKSTWPATETAPSLC